MPLKKAAGIRVCNDARDARHFTTNPHLHPQPRLIALDWLYQMRFCFLPSHLEHPRIYWKTPACSIYIEPLSEKALIKLHFRVFISPLSVREASGGVLGKKIKNLLMCWHVVRRLRGQYIEEGWMKAAAPKCLYRESAHSKQKVAFINGRLTVFVYTSFTNHDYTCTSGCSVIR